jgi:hypothetical protein
MRRGPLRVRWVVACCVVPALLVLVPVAHAGGPGGTDSSRAEVSERLARLRIVYLAAVNDEGAIAEGLRSIEEIRSAAQGAHLHATLSAYQAALITLRAKHAFWPQSKLRHLREGLAMLDSVVGANPAHAEARYLRLMSCYYLPGLLGRGWSVREDFTALARLLPYVEDEYPPDLLAAVTRFVLQHGRPAADQRRRLETLLAALDE